MAEGDADITLNVPVGLGGDGEGEGMGLGAAITDQLSQSIQNMDLVKVLQKMVAQTPEDEESVEIRDKLRGVLQQFKDMTDDDKAMFTNRIKEGLKNKLSMKLKDSGAFSNIEEAVRSAIMTRLYMVAAGVVLLIILIIFFGYKLYKSIKDKEKKIEEKKKAKQMKKKK
ncbi:uncharacterized protein LOC142984499 [Anticarsia gemmatalis]|uniref:uncharacterized protein LOC142984499 n=1 Tax=Anticarsia gemmatalis TaxID=129554 RepID=UPI003F76B3C6